MSAGKSLLSWMIKERTDGFYGKIPEHMPDIRGCKEKITYIGESGLYCLSSEHAVFHADRHTGQHCRRGAAPRPAAPKNERG